MANYSLIKENIDENITNNGQGEITGPVLNAVLNSMVDVLGAGYQFMGFADTETDPGTPDARVFYLTTEAGTYTNFGGSSVTVPTIFYYDTEWHAKTLDGDFSATLRVADIINNLTSSATNKPLSANQGKVLKGLHDTMKGIIEAGDVFMGVATDETVPEVSDRDYSYAWLAATAGTYTNMGDLVVSAGEIAVLRRYTTAGDTTAWEKKSLGVYLTSADIVDNLNSSDATKPLSAKQGKALKALIDAGYTYGGTITSEDARTPSLKIFFLATTAGTIHGITVAENEIAFIKYDGSDWSKDSLGILATAAELNAAVELLTIAIDAKYTKPAGGIPATDMTEAVQTSLGKADTAVQPTELAETLEDYAKIEDLEDGTVVPKLAENLDSWEGNNHPVDNNFDNTVRTTAGEDPIDTDAGGLLLAIKAVSDFKCTGLLATAENQLRLKSDGGGAVAVGTGWYFPVPTLTYGAFGTADENNGLILVASDGSNIQNASVYFKAFANGVPTGVTDGVAATSQTITYNGKTYKVYTTSGPGYLIVSDITYAETCARIAWEDWYDKFVSPTAQDDLGGSIDLTALFAAAPNGTGKFIVCGGSATHAERISASQWKITDPVGRIASPVWTDTPDEVGEGEPQTYTHTLTITGIADNGIAVIEGSVQSLSVDGTTVSYTDTNATAISGAVRYELATPATATVNLASAYTLNDVGVEMKEGAVGEADFTIQYSQNIADTLAIGAPKLNTLRTDAAAISLGYGLCTTGTYTKDKVVTIPNFMLLQNGTINVLFTTPINTERSTLNVSLTGAKPLRILGQILPAGVVKAQTYAALAYDGESWNIVSLFHPDYSLMPSSLVVDMGLTSGTKWAARDIDITKPGGFCDTPFVYEKSFFSWGNIDGHNPLNGSFANVYNWGSVNAQEPWYDGQPYGSTKGNTLAGDIPVGEEFDAARANLGSPWRMPTTAEFAELFAGCIYIDATGTEIPSETTNKLVTVNGIVGLYLQSKTNGNRLFFAASGYGIGSSWGRRGSVGGYWSGSFGSARYARYLGFDSGGVYPQYSDYRYYGFAVRPVQ